MTVPKSVASSVTAAVGVVCLATAIMFQIATPAASTISGALFLVLLFLIPVAGYEILVRRIHRWPSTG